MWVFDSVQMLENYSALGALNVIRVSNSAALCILRFLHIYIYIAHPPANAKYHVNVITKYKQNFQSIVFPLGSFFFEYHKAAVASSPVLQFSSSYINTYLFV